MRTTNRSNFSILIQKGAHKMNKKAFTLAEVLITLTIIGVIAAITIPTLMKKYQNHANYTALKKTYSVLSNAYKMIERDYARYTDWPETGGAIHVALAERMEEYLKIQKKCSHNQCFGYTHYTLNPKAETTLGRAGNGTDTMARSYILTDGTIILFGLSGGQSAMSYEIDRDDENSTTAIYVDVNGKKGPNQFGRDIFTFFIQKSTNWWYQSYGVPNSGDKILPAGYTNIVKNHNNDSCNPLISSYGYGCAARALIQDDGIKY